MMMTYFHTEEMALAAWTRIGPAILDRSRSLRPT